MNSAKIYYSINKKLKEGDHNTFIKIYLDNNKLLYNYIKKYIIEEYIIDDIIHDSFVLLWNARERINTHYKVENYLFKIVKNSIFKHYKEKIKKDYVQKNMQDSFINSYNNSPEQVLEHLEFDKIYKLAIDQLPPQRKRIFKLSREDGLSYNEIAKILNISPNTVKEHMSLAMKTIKLYLTKEHDLVLGYIAISLLYNNSF